MTNNNTIQELAQRIYNYMAPWDREYKTVDDIAEDIKNDPAAVIQYLMDELQYLMDELTEA